MVTVKLKGVAKVRAKGQTLLRVVRRPSFDRRTRKSGISALLRGSACTDGHPR